MSDSNLSSSFQLNLAGQDAARIYRVAKRNGAELINQLRNSHSTSTISADSTQEGTLSAMDGQEEAIDNELYLQGMDTEIETGKSLEIG